MNRRRILFAVLAGSAAAVVAVVSAAQLEKQQWIDFAPDSPGMARARAETPGSFLDLDELIGSPLTMDGGILYSAVRYPGAQTVTVSVCVPRDFAALQAVLVKEDGLLLQGTPFGPAQHGVQKFYFETADDTRIRFIDLVDADSLGGAAYNPISPFGIRRIRFDLRYA